MNEELKKAIEGSKLLSDEQKKRFVEAGEKLSPEQVREALTLLQEANQKHATLLEEGLKKEREINEKYVQDMKRLIPYVMKEIEKEERVSEASDLENVILKLDNV